MIPVHSNPHPWSARLSGAFWLALILFALAGVLAGRFGAADHHRRNLADSGCSERQDHAAVLEAHALNRNPSREVRPDSSTMDGSSR